MWMVVEKWASFSKWLDSGITASLTARINSPAPLHCVCLRLNALLHSQFCSDSLKFRALLSNLLLLPCLLWHQLTRQLPFPRDNLRRQQWWEIFPIKYLNISVPSRKKVQTYIIQKHPDWKDTYLWTICDWIYHDSCDEFVF